jgi:hypothetical protein
VGAKLFHAYVQTDIQTDRHTDMIKLTDALCLKMITNLEHLLNFDVVFSYEGKINGTLAPVLAIMAYRGSRGLVSLILTLGTRW